ncbi:ABC transporter permease [Sphingomonas sp. C3-2]|uniref:ABC transporter permease n=1 Tax=Sphingomonas sp. C3-2 TaxID=3062169 RepID=UPI00294A9E06|nr:FtsX-like permease family protein [Sphingomonas sp. C3-2]WOK37515.1 FtsX-like permease family protein [Sphingomonas sp. C3-2]
MSSLGWRTSWRIARRDLHAGFRGLRLLFICLFLGVATLAAIGSLTASITDEIAARGQTLLGGDIEVAMTQREANADEKAELRRLGTLSETIRMRAMAQREGTSQAVLTELKGVDTAYPLYGSLTLDASTYARSLRPDQILIGRALAERLNVGRGDPVRYGAASFTIADIIADEPDRVGEGFTLGPVALVSIDGLRRTGLIQPGSLFTSKYRIRLAPGADAQALRKSLEKTHVSDGWELKDRDRAAPGANRFFVQMGQFLSLIGLAALVIAGIGVSNGVSSYLALKRGGIATFKVLGATAADIERIYLLQVGCVAALAIASGLVMGAVLQPAIVALGGDMLPVRPGFRLHPLPLATSAAYGLLIALIFTLPPLARARTQPAAAIFRSVVDPRRFSDRRTITLVGLAGFALVALAILTAHEPFFSAAVLGAVAAIFFLLFVLGWLVRQLAQRAPRPRRPLWRLALTNLYRPGAQTTALVVALGLALTLFVAMAAIQTSLQAEISRTVPKTAPNLFVLDIPSTEESRFRDLVAAETRDPQVNIVPALRGTIVAYAGKRVAELKELPAGAWFLRGERGVTYSAELPEGSDLVAGTWWPEDYAGPPLISLDEEAAKILNIGVGDTLTVSVLGREIEARIASLRKVNWDTMGFNYVLVFSPNTLTSAPHSLAATITMDQGRDEKVTQALLGGFPGVSVIAVGEVIAQVGGLLEQMSSAILAAASVAILAGIAVLIGAIAASRQARSYDSVILKTLGATRLQVLGTQALEYGLLAALLSFVSLALGSAAAWYVVVKVFEFGWAPDWGTVLATLAGGALLTLGIGLAGSLPLMSVRPAQALRQL